jgi:hypothetical protein
MPLEFTANPNQHIPESSNFRIKITKEVCTPDVVNKTQLL